VVQKECRMPAKPTAIQPRKTETGEFEAVNELPDIADMEASIALGSGLAGAASAIKEAAATDSMLADMGVFRDTAERWKNLIAKNPEAGRGRLFEAIETAKFNRNAALRGSTLRARMTETVGRPHDVVDVEITAGKKVVRGYQLKCGKSAAHSTHAISDPKYNDPSIGKVVPKDQAAKAKELAGKRAQTGTLKRQDYQDTAKKVRGDVRHGKVSSGGTTSKEVIKAGKRPRTYAFAQEMGSLGREAGKAGAAGAAAGGIISGAVSLVSNSVKAGRGDISAGTAAKNVGRDSAKGAVKGGATGAGGAVVRYTAKKGGMKLLSKSNIATTVAAAAIESGVAIRDYARGEISEGELAQKLGNTGTSTLSSIYVGAAAGAVFGPVGAIVGSVGGFLVASGVYQSCVSILRQADLAEEEAARIKKLCNEAIEWQSALQAQIEKESQELLGKREILLAKTMASFDAALVTGDFWAASGSIGELAHEFGVTITSPGEIDGILKSQSNDELII